MNEEEKIYAFWLQGIPGIGNKTMSELFEKFGSFHDIYTAQEGLLRQCLREKQVTCLLEYRRKEEFRKQYEEMIKKDIQMVCFTEKHYPRRLLEIADAPYMLFFKGGLPNERRPSVAIIGARECSEYGAYVAKELGKFLGRRGIQVISGMARGIDGISQLAAVSEGGCSFGVLGNGVDICYPKSNQKLYEQLLEKGGVLSSYAPGVLPTASNFPPRNRIVSGLADAVVVVEARNKSGTLITVDMALEQGKEVFVVPGRVTDRLSDGCNRLLSQGANVFLNPEDFVRQLAEQYGTDILQEENRKELLDEKDNLRKKAMDGIDRCKMGLEEVVEQYVSLDPSGAEEIWTKMCQDGQKISYEQMLPCFMKLCMEGRVKQITPGKYVKILL